MASWWWRRWRRWCRAPTPRRSSAVRRRRRLWAPSPCVCAGGRCEERWRAPRAPPWPLPSPSMAAVRVPWTSTWVEERAPLRRRGGHVGAAFEGDYVVVVERRCAVACSHCTVVSVHSYSSKFRPQWHLSFFFVLQELSSRGNSTSCVSASYVSLGLCSV